MIHNGKLVHVLLVVKDLSPQCLLALRQLCLVHFCPGLKFLDLSFELIDYGVLKLHVLFDNLLLLIHLLSFLLHQSLHLRVQLLLLFLHPIVLL